jgi:alkylation response protein AidB-like acyl-CoA dehydrogenase
MTHEVPAGGGLTAAAVTVRGVAAKYARDADSARKLAPDVIHSIVDSGFPRQFVPSEYGGNAGGFADLVAATSIVAQGCASAAWVASVSAAVGRMAAFLPAQARAEIWGERPDKLVVGALMPFGRAKPTEGGWWLTGDWPYISGIDFSDWALVCGRTPAPEGGKPETRYFAVPRAAYEVVDTWFNAGMRGSGSNTLVLQNVFVPEHRSVAQQQVLTGTGTDLTEPCYSAPLNGVNGLPFAACVLGAVRGMQASWSTSMSQKIHADGSLSRASFDEPLARSAGEIDMAELLLDRAAILADEGGLDAAHAARSSRDCALAAGSLLDTANRLFALSGSGAHADNSPIGRAWRDAHAGASHLALRFATAATNYAEQVLKGAWS